METGGGGGTTCAFNEHENFHYENVQDIHTSSKNHEESDYGLDLDLPTIWC